MCLGTPSMLRAKAPVVAQTKVCSQQTARIGRTKHLIERLILQGEMCTHIHVLYCFGKTWKTSSTTGIAIQHYTISRLPDVNCAGKRYLAFYHKSSSWLVNIR